MDGLGQRESSSLREHQESATLDHSPTLDQHQRLFAEATSSRRDITTIKSIGLGAPLANAEFLQAANALFLDNPIGVLFHIFQGVLQKQVETLDSLTGDKRESPPESNEIPNTVSFSERSCAILPA